MGLPGATSTENNDNLCNEADVIHPSSYSNTFDAKILVVDINPEHDYGPLVHWP